MTTGRTMAQAKTIREDQDVEAAAPQDPSRDVIDKVTHLPLTAEATRLLANFAPTESVEQVVYISTPITTGPRLLAWLATHRASTLDSDSQSGSTTDPAAEIVREEVIAENLARLDPVRASVHDRYPHSQLIDPTVLSVPGWVQQEYHRFWVEVIRSFVDRIVFADGWHLSTGCVIEYAAALEAGIPTEDASGHLLPPESTTQLLRRAADTLADAGRDSTIALAAANRAERAGHTTFKDADLAALASAHNVASFVSLASHSMALRHLVLRESTQSRSIGPEAAIKHLLRTSPSESVNVRTFRPGSNKGNPFKYGLKDVASAIQAVVEFTRDGYYCIVNETIDIHDGGVSGVTLGGIAEFAPDDTPRAVEKEGAARMPVQTAHRVLRSVYGDSIQVPERPNTRIEFSVHPARVGHRAEHVVVWESEAVEDVELAVETTWPNKFSRLVGDKTFGLLIADATGAPVPATTVVSRRVAPFRFGRATGTGEWWMRTAPADQTPGHFTTTRGWTDPFAILAKEDADATVASILAQEGVNAIYSGASLPRSDGNGHIIEGVAGSGSDFMLGGETTTTLPTDLIERVESVLVHLQRSLGPGVRIEWAADSDTVWVLQLHRTDKRGETGVFSVGDAERWLTFDPSDGLEALSEMIAEARATGAGIEVTQPVGLTSHVGDLLRRANVPGRLSVDPKVS